MKWVWYLKQGGWCEGEEEHSGCQTLSPQQPVEKTSISIVRDGTSPLTLPFQKTSKGSYK